MGITMKTSARGIKGIETFEGVILSAYPDPASPLGKALTANKLTMPKYRSLINWQSLKGDPWTIGAGWTGLVNGQKIEPGMAISQQTADDLLASELVKFEKEVLAMVKVPMTQGMFDALVSFAWNLGSNNLKQSRLLKYLNNGNKGLAAAEFLNWTKAGGKVMNGLVSRRKTEQSWFLE